LEISFGVLHDAYLEPMKFSHNFKESSPCPKLLWSYVHKLLLQVQYIFFNLKVANTCQSTGNFLIVGFCDNFQFFHNMLVIRLSVASFCFGYS